MFELFIAGRYLRAKRKQVMISVITVISVIGVATGVMALVIAIAIGNGTRNTILRASLAARAHVTVTEEVSGAGIEGWQEIAQKLSGLPRVQDVTPALFDGALVAGPKNYNYAQIKGISTDSSRYRPGLLKKLKQGDFDDLRTQEGLPGVILGSELAEAIGAVVGETVTVINPKGNVTPFGYRSRDDKVRVAGIFESGMSELDSVFAFMDLREVQRLWDYPDVVNAIELHLDDVDASREVAKAASGLVPANLKVVTWEEENNPLLEAFKMFRKATVITIGLIQLVAALNILTTLVMMVMEKRRDIAVLMSMGARASQIRRIFIYKGALIGAVGTAIGLVLGYGISYLANKYQWLLLDTKMFVFRYVPLEPAWTDGIWIAALAMAVSLLATVYPARSATKVAPVESMRYE